MTVTYPHDRPQPHPAPVQDVREEPFVPVYARDRRGVRSRKSGLKTWMILAPLGVLVLAGSAALLVMGDRDDAAPAPLAEPAATAPVLPVQPLLTEAAPVEAIPAAEATPAPVPLVRRTAPAPARRAAAPVRAATPAPTPTPRVVVPAESAGPQPYTATLNTTPAPAPVIVIQPAD
jgi:hypothetical protein